MDNQDINGLDFLNRLYKDLHLKEEVMHTAVPSDSKNRKVEKYLDRLERIEEKVQKSSYNDIELLKSLYYKKYIIKAENVPESYFELQKNIALERGFGHIEISPETREIMIQSLIDDQKKSLDMWLDYLLDGASQYPEWFKYYAFQGMIKLGSYDKKKAAFNKRTDSTINMFVDLNREALSLVYDNLCSTLAGEKVNDDILQGLLEGGSFSKLYSYMLNKLESSNKDIDSNDGIWIKYDQGSDPDKLVKTLEGRGTGWCTAGKSTAEYQLKNGDFYVYYTKDSNGEYVQPRVAIRMEGNSIGEIRGIASNQNIEPDMEKVVEEKIKDFPDKDSYLKRVSDMKRLTDLYDKYTDVQKQIDELNEKIGPIEENNHSFDDEPIDEKAELRSKFLDLYEYFDNKLFSQEELRFLYEIDSDIEGFGYDKDPRIYEIIKTRDFKKDLSLVFNCQYDEISDNILDVHYGKKLVCFYGNLSLNSLPFNEVTVLPQIVIGNVELNIRDNQVVFPEMINGDLSINANNYDSNFDLPRDIRGSLGIDNLKSAKRIRFPEKIGLDLILADLETVEGLVLPDEIPGSLSMRGMSEIENFEFPSTIGEDLALNCTSLKNVILPTRIGGTMHLKYLESVDGLVFPDEIGDDLYLSSVTSIENFKFPRIVNGDVYLNRLLSVKNVEFPNYVRGKLALPRLKDGNGVKLPEKVGRSVYLYDLTTVKGLALPTEVGDFIELSHLKDIENLIIPDGFKGSLFFEDLETTKGLKLPKKFFGDLVFHNLHSAEGLVLPEEVMGSLALGGLSNDNGLVLPKKIGKNLDLRNLRSMNGLVFPDELGGNLILTNLVCAVNSKLPAVIKYDLSLPNLKMVSNFTLPRTIGRTLSLGINSSNGLIIPEGLTFQQFVGDENEKEELLALANGNKKTKGNIKGYSQVILLGLLSAIVSFGLLILGVLLT